MISTRDLSQLPDADGLRRLLQSLAMLDAILCPESQYRYYSFNAAWAGGEKTGSMRDGCGDDFRAHFGAAGCWLKGFAHESLMSPCRVRPPAVWPGVLDGVPAEFAGCLREPAFAIEATTFCVWRRWGDPALQTGPVAFPPGHPDPDGSAARLSALDGRPESYRDWAADYYEREVPLAAVAHVYAHRPLTGEFVARLNPEASLDELTAEVGEIGYPGS